MKLTRLPVVLAMAAALVGGGLNYSPEVAAEAKPDDGGHAECVDDCGKPAKHEDEAPAEEAGPAVVIVGGTVSNVTTLDITADGGTGVADASGGDANVAIAGGGTEFDAEGNAIGDVASVGNGGIAEADANGGAVSVGNVNSGGNAGNAIVVGNTYADGGECHDCGKPVEPKPVCCEKPSGPSAGKPDAPKTVTVNTGGGSKGGNASSGGGSKGGDKVKGLPSTGAGLVAGESGSTAALLFLAVGALGAAGYSLRRRVA